MAEAGPGARREARALARPRRLGHRPFLLTRVGPIELRPFTEADRAAVDDLVSAAWPDDPALARISSIHAPSSDDGDRLRRTVVATEDDRVIGGGTIHGSALHPTRFFVVVVVRRSHRCRGVGTLLLERLVELGDARPLIARVREHDDPGLAFLRAHGFELLMRNRVGVVDPQDRRVRAWEAGALRTRMTLVPNDRAREEVARLHEAAYRREHASWAPVAGRPPEEWVDLFCGDSWLPDSAFVAYEGSRPVGVASAHGLPLAETENELALIVGATVSGAVADSATRALVAAELGFARDAGKLLSVEADEANDSLWRVLHELPAERRPDLLLLATDSSAHGARHSL